MVGFTDFDERITSLHEFENKLIWAIEDVIKEHVIRVATDIPAASPEMIMRHLDNALRYHTQVSPAQVETINDARKRKG